MEHYLSKRAEVLAIEESMRIGSKLKLSCDEQKLSNWLGQIKSREYDEGVADPTKFLAAHHFFQARPAMEQTEIFKMIQKMPKGAILHAHDWGLVSEEFLFELTFADNLYMSESNGRIEFTFSTNDLKTCGCKKWRLLSELRKTTDDLDGLNRRIREAFTICVDNPLEAYPNGYAIWRRFESIFGALVPLLTYKPVHEKYWTEVFQEMLNDNIMYMEFRGTLPDVYDLDGTIYTGLEVVRIYKEIMEQFKVEHPEFRGARFIYAPIRKVDNKTCCEYVNLMKDMIREFPDFVAGFDLVGQEELGEPLLEFIDALNKIKPDVKFFFHAGETNWNGSSVDLNLVDAISMQATRIGHGYALPKHPYLFESIKQQNIAVEVCPVSNQVLGLVSDLRNHPAAQFFAQDIPVVVSSDDPAMWGARGLSHDFYVTFMALMHKSADLRALKQLALNSIKYSVMPPEELEEAYAQFDRDWDKFVKFYVENIRS